jgi:hypothetical protein
MKNTDFTIKFDTEINETLIYLPEFGSIITCENYNVYITPLTDTGVNYQDYEEDLSPILHWIHHMYSVDSMREVITHPDGLKGNTKQFRRVYNQLMRELNAYKLDNISVISESTND